MLTGELYMNTAITEAKQELEMRYYTYKGRKLPSVTSIISAELPHPEIRQWIQRLGKEKARRKTVERAVIGQVIHHRLLNKYAIRSMEPPSIQVEHRELSEWVQEVEHRSELAEMMWEQLPIEITGAPYVERTLYSEKGFAGTADFIGYVDGVKTLADIKTGFMVYSDVTLQLGAYEYCLEEEYGESVEQGMVFHIHPFEDRNKCLEPALITFSKDELFTGRERFFDVFNRFKSKSR